MPSTPSRSNDAPEDATLPEPSLPTFTQLMVLPLATSLGRAGRKFREVSTAFERLDPDAQAALQLARLQTLLTHAVQAPRHRERLASAGFKPGDLRSLADLGRLPLLEKADLTNGAAEGWLTRHPLWRHTVRTSGTTGRPLSLQTDLAWWSRSLARRQLLFARHGIRYGAREGRLWGRSGQASRVSLKDRLGSRRTFQFLGGDEHSLVAEAHALREFAPTYLYGYPSIARETAHAWAALRLPPMPSLQAIVLTAERISPSDQQFISRTFGCRVLREYGCCETDILAFDCEFGAYHVVADHVVIEVLDPCDGLGECVVTDLDNSLMPLVRYRLGDRIRLSTASCPCGRTTPVIASIEGRTGDARYLYLPDGRRLHTVLFAYMFEDLAAEGVPVRQFKVRQVARDTVVVNLDPGAAVPLVDLPTILTTAVRQYVDYPLTVKVAIGPLPEANGSKWNYFDPLPPELRPID